MKTLLDNIWMKLFSVVLALTIWLYVQGRERVETAVSFRISFSDVPAEHYVDDVSVGEVSVWVKAPRAVADKLVRAGNGINFSMKNLHAGKHSFRIESSNLKLPATANMARVEPSEVTVRLSPYMVKRVRVTADYEGKLDSSIKPTSITVKGEKKAVESLRQVLTEKIPDDTKPGKVSVRLLETHDGVLLSQKDAIVTLKQ